MSRDNGSSWATTEVTEHQHLNLFDATLFITCGRAWTLWHVDFDPASPSITTLVCGCKLWFICQDVEASRRLCRGDSSLQGLIYLLNCNNPDLKSIRWALQRPRDSIVLPFAAAHCVVTFFDKAASTTTAMLSHVINAEDEEQEQREQFVKMRFATGDRRVGLHGN